jgi:hypothetical protein
MGGKEPAVGFQPDRPVCSLAGEAEQPQGDSAPKALAAILRQNKHAGDLRDMRIPTPNPAGADNTVLIESDQELAKWGNIQIAPGIEIGKRFRPIQERTNERVGLVGEVLSPHLVYQFLHCRNVFRL